MTQKIERIDTIPLIIAILTKMRVQQTIDIFLCAMETGPGSVMANWQFCLSHMCCTP